MKKETIQLYETKIKWDGKKNVCVYCKKEPYIKYIITNCSKTDYSYSTCDCKGARKRGKQYEKLI